MTESDIVKFNYPDIDDLLMAYRKIRPCKFLMRVEPKKAIMDVLVGEEIEAIGKVSINAYSPDGYYCQVEIAISGQRYCLDLRRYHYEKVAEFTAICILRHIRDFGHFQIGEFESNKYWQAV